MLLRGVATLLSLSILIQATLIPQTANDTIASSAVTGYKNVAYFVNWVRFAQQKMSKIYFTDNKYRPSMVATSTLKIFQAKNLLTLFTLSLMFDQRPVKST
jgi:hypothetical protein